jgi:beta-N-acetylhexosaminidase
MTLGPVMLDIEGLALTAEDRELLRHPNVGGVILFARNYESPEQLARLTGEIHALRRPELVVAVDQEGGRVQRFREGFTRLPPMHLLGRRYDLERDHALQLAETCGWLMAAELRAAGVDLSFAPVLDLDYGLSEVIGDRAFHRDPEAWRDLAGRFAAGMRHAGMASVGKHFPGHGGVVADSHHALPEDRRPYADLLDDMRPYER